MYKAQHAAPKIMAVFYHCIQSTAWKLLGLVAGYTSATVTGNLSIEPPCSELNDRLSWGKLQLSRLTGGNCISTLAGFNRSCNSAPYWYWVASTSWETPWLGVRNCFELCPELIWAVPFMENRGPAKDRSSFST